MCKAWQRNANRQSGPKRGHALFWRLVLFVLWAALLSGCGLLSGSGLFASSDTAPAAQTAASSSGEPPSFVVDDPMPYTLHLTVDPPDTDVLNRFMAASALALQKDRPPDGRLELERRLAADKLTALKALHADGYYDGQVHEQVDWDAEPVRVEMTLLRGERYTLGPQEVSYTNSAQQANLPTAVPGLEPGEPAVAQRVLDAVDGLTGQLRNEGYPHVEMADSRYEIDRATRTLESMVTMQPGPRLFMGPVRFEGAPHVNDAFASRLAPWKPGQAWWSDKRALILQDRLRETGLFRSVRVEPDGEAAAASLHEGDSMPVRVVVTEAPPRTVGGGVKYASDVGFGVQGYWEHRNLWGDGEQLRLAAPLSQERQEFSASFARPFFGGLNQRLLLEALALNEDNEAYSQTAALTGIGLERNFGNRLKGSVRATLEGGRLDDATRGRTSYAMLGLPTRLAHDSTDNLLNPTRGWRWQLGASPYTGRYGGGTFTAVRLWAEASAYFAPLEGDRLVLAARAAAGSLVGSGAMALPPSLRFYAGGGGSVRGYKYRSLGAGEVSGEPVGGRSVTEMGLEARLRITETIGLVPFLDGGGVYSDSMPRVGRDLYFGAGLGLRYHSPIGPVRFDVALPLRKAPDGSKYQLYISIGQAF